MTQYHCEIKTEMYKEFDKLGVQTRVEEEKENNNQSFRE